ncbi:SRPBCC family protein [Streptomyces sp. DSM 44915]|uniref:SRPBCC family protein n=1 Tax=Streptomyces chisholmiae TaxID=3075540 RepID=A0ABU2JMM5_9ACTN|nr:SRPBCC family protein [Streptomyces sp. DSM 44915]MDT0265774.1 SRPBCC family protein [Streptomyces sp. DSM 44915]
MAVRHRLIARPPAAVWDVLGDASRYADWVVGTRASEPAEGTWPEVGSALSYTVRLAGRDLHGRTWVRRCEPPRALELEADSGPLGTARIALDIRPWGAETLVIMDEHPLRGLGGRLHNAVLDAAQQLRHRGMLKRLARLVEEREPAATSGPVPHAPRARP